jgi:hypothetical protein
VHRQWKLCRTQAATQGRIHRRLQMLHLVQVLMTLCNHLSSASVHCLLPLSQRTKRTCLRACPPQRQQRHSSAHRRVPRRAPGAHLVVMPNRRPQLIATC